MSKDKFSSHCIQMFEVYSDYIDGNLDEIQNKDIKDHIKNCAQCQLCIASLQKTKELCSKLPQIKTPENFTQKLHNKIFDIINKK